MGAVMHAVRTAPAFAFVLALAVTGAGSARAEAIRDLGHIRADRSIEIGVLMRHRNDLELAQLVRLQGTRGSPLHHHFLTNAQWKAYFAPDAGTYEGTVRQLTAHGFRITRTFDDRSMIRAAAPARTVEAYFRTRLDAVLQPRYGALYRNVTPYVLPAELRNVAIGIAGLDATVQAQTFDRLWAPAERHLRAPAPNPAAAAPAAFATTTPGPNPSPDPTLSPLLTPEEDIIENEGYGPAIWADAYDFPVQHGYGGHGEPVGSVIAGDFSDVDVAYEDSVYKLPRTGTNHRVYTGPTTTASFVEEADLDAEVLTTLAPAADFYEYISEYLNELGVEGAYAQAVSDDTVVALNSSFGACETYSPSFEYATNYLAEEGAAKGITFVAAAGDSGSSPCGYTVTNGVPGESLGVEVPCADTYVVCLGGTEFEPITSVTGYYTGEMAWTGGGGGVSVLEPLPDWQATTSGVTAGGRNVPDLSMTADPAPPGVAWVVIIADGIQPAGGTSIASPMFVALQAEIDQAQKSRAGFVTPSLYALYAAYPAFAFRDVTLGTNGMYSAKKGYDDATGLGTPLGFELAGSE